MAYVRPTQPSSIARVLADGFSLYRASIRSLYVPVFWIALVVGLIHWGQIPYQSIGEGVSLGVGHWLRQLASLVASIYMYGVIIAIVHYIASGAPRDVRSPIAIATRRFPALLAVFLLCGLAIFIGPVLLTLLLLLLGLLLGTHVVFAGLLLVLVPMIFLAVALFASSIVAVAEGHGPIDSMRESYAMVRGHWWPTFAVIAIATAISTAISFATNGIALSLTDLFDSIAVSNAVSTLIYAALWSVIAPLSGCLMYGAYRDLRLRRNDVASSA